MATLLYAWIDWEDSTTSIHKLSFIKLPRKDYDDYKAGDSVMGLFKNYNGGSNSKPGECWGDIIEISADKKDLERQLAERQTQQIQDMEGSEAEDMDDQSESETEQATGDKTVDAIAVQGGKKRKAKDVEDPIPKSVKAPTARQEKSNRDAAAAADRQLLRDITQQRKASVLELIDASIDEEKVTYLEESFATLNPVYLPPVTSTPVLNRKGYHTVAQKQPRQSRLPEMQPQCSQSLVARPCSSLEQSCSPLEPPVSHLEPPVSHLEPPCSPVAPRRSPVAPPRSPVAPPRSPVASRTLPATCQSCLLLKRRIAELEQRLVSREGRGQHAQTFARPKAGVYSENASKENKLVQLYQGYNAYINHDELNRAKNKLKKTADGIDGKPAARYLLSVFFDKETIAANSLSEMNFIIIEAIIAFATTYSTSKRSAVTRALRSKITAFRCKSKKQSDRPLTV